MTEFQEREKKFKQEYEDLERRYNSILWKLETAQNENKILAKQLNDFNNFSTSCNKYQKNIADDECLSYNEIIKKCKDLEDEIEFVKIAKKNKIKLYKKKINNLEMILNQVISEKDRKINELEENIQNTARKSPCRSPLRSCKISRRNSNNKLQEISQMIVSLEKSQAEYKQKYINLQKTKSASFAEINHLYDMLKNNEKRLKEAKKLQENLLKSNYVNN